MIGFELGVDYPEPMLDLKVTHKDARDRLYGARKSPEIKEEASRIIEKHTLGNR